MKKKMIRFFAAAAASGALGLALSAGVMPGVAFADEAQVQEGIEETYKITAEAIFRNENRVVLPEEYSKYGQVIVDKTEAKAGETVTIKAVGGTEAGFWPRFNIKRTSDGTDVTEALLGERQKHDLSGESFVMPDYDIKVSAESADAWEGSPPVPSIMVDGYDMDNALIYPVKTVQTTGGLISIVNADELIPLPEDFSGGSYGVDIHGTEDKDIVVKAVPEPGYRFVKWFAYGNEFGVGVTDDILKSTSAQPDENGIITTTSTFKMPYAGFVLNAVFEEAESHNISIEKRHEDITAETDKTSAKAGEKVHIKVDTGTQIAPDDLIGIIITNASTGEEIKRIDGFKDHEHTWEGDIVMPDHDIAIEIASLKWVPAEMVTGTHYALIQTEGGKIYINKDVGVEGEKMTLSYTPDDGYGFVKWIVKDAEGNDITEEVNIKEDGTFDGLKGGEYYISAVFGKVDSAAYEGTEKTVAANAASKSPVVSSGAAATRAVSGTTAAPRTGDDNNSAVWMAAGLAAAAAGALGVVKLRKMKKED